MNTTIDDMLNSFDWKYIFENYVSGYTHDDIERVVASDDGENDGVTWVAVFELHDGRYAMVSAWCDYTGWG